MCTLLVCSATRYLSRLDSLADPEPANEQLSVIGEDVGGHRAGRQAIETTASPTPLQEFSGDRKSYL